MYGNKCEKCGATENARALKAGGIAVILCVKCERALNAAIHATPEWREYIRRGGTLDDICRRAAVATATDTALWDSLRRLRWSYQTAAEALHKQTLAWVEAECNPQKEPSKSTEGAEPDEAQL